MCHGEVIVTIFRRTQWRTSTFVYYYDEEIKGKDRVTENTYIYVHECRCNKRLNAKTERSTRLVYTGLCTGLEHLKIETRLSGERFESVKGDCVI